jgi:hypothetical protein
LNSEGGTLFRSCTFSERDERFFRITRNTCTLMSTTAVMGRKAAWKAKYLLRVTSVIFSPPRTNVTIQSPMTGIAEGIELSTVADQ